jgi:hypothetical protein
MLFWCLVVLMLIAFGARFFVSYQQAAQVARQATDPIPPTVTLDVPAASITLATGEPVKVSALAKDNVAVSRVEFSVDGVVLVKQSKPPFETDWSPEFPGLYQVAVVAKDTAGNKGADYKIVEVLGEKVKSDSLFGGK